MTATNETIFDAATAMTHEDDEKFARMSEAVMDSRAIHNYQDLDIRTVPEALLRAMRTKQLVRKQPKIGRNELCPCGSGLKFKKCKCEQFHPVDEPEYEALGA